MVLLSKVDLLDAAVSLFAPHECLVCGNEPELLCSECAERLKLAPPACAMCGVLSPDFETCKKCSRLQKCQRVYVRTAFTDLPRRLIAKSKYERAVAAHTVIAREINDILPQHMPGFVVVHVPTTNAHVRERGFDHAERVTSCVARNQKLTHQTLLVRIGNQSQVGKKRADRLLINPKTFRFKGDVIPEKVLLIDDVKTTGATLAAASKVLCEAGVKHIYAATYAAA